MPLRKNSRIPCVRELREPIVLARSSRLPEEGVGFKTTLTVYGRAWAKVKEGNMKWLNGVQCDPFAGISIKMRHNDQMQVAITDVIRWGNRLFRVASVALLDDERRFCQLVCREDPSMTSPDALANPPKIVAVLDPPAQVEDPDRANHSNPWF